MTLLLPADAERLKLAFQRCREMEGSLNEQLQAYAKAGREIFPAYGEAVDRLVVRVNETIDGFAIGRKDLPACSRIGLELLVESAFHLAAALKGELEPLGVG